MTRQNLTALRSFRSMLGELFNRVYDVGNCSPMSRVMRRARPTIKTNTSMVNTDVIVWVFIDHRSSLSINRAMAMIKRMQSVSNMGVLSGQDKG